MHFSTFKAPKPHILFQRALARDLQVPNMREGFWKFTQRVTVAGFGRTENRKYSESDTAKVNFFAHVYVTLTIQDRTQEQTRIFCRDKQMETKLWVSLVPYKRLKSRWSPIAAKSSEQLPLNQSTRYVRDKEMPTLATATVEDLLWPGRVSHTHVVNSVG